MMNNFDNDEPRIQARFFLSLTSYFLLLDPVHCSGDHLLSRAVSSQVSLTARGLTAVFGMGTSVPRGRIGTRLEARS